MIEQCRPLEGRRTKTTRNRDGIGASFCKRTGKWRATIQYYGRKYSLGYHKCRAAAIVRYEQEKVFVEINGYVSTQYKH